MRIVFDPKTGKTNAYVDIVIGFLKESGFEIYSLSEAFRSWKALKQIEVFHLNWYENLDTAFDFAKKIVKLLVLLMLGKRIVWTMHNKVPHNGRVVLLQKILTNLLIKHAETIVVHSKETVDILRSKGAGLERKAKYIPHPNYYGVYGNKSHVRHPCKKLSLLFLGAVKKYKNIELLIDSVSQLPSDSVSLVIAGKPETAEYGSELLNGTLADKSIEFDLGYISDEKMIDYIEKCDLLVLPYDIKSSLNSGSVILAFSYARTVLTPLIGTISDIQDKSYLMTYSYHDKTEHGYQLVSMLNQAVKLKKSNPGVFHTWGEKMLESTLANNSNEIVKSRFVSLYK